MQTSCQGTKAYHSENVTFDLGTFTANKVNSIWFLTLILGLDVLTFQSVSGACSLIQLEGAWSLKWSAPLSGGIG